MPDIEANGVRLHYRIDGARNDRGVILFSNSLSSDLSMWDLQVDACVAAGWRTVRYDTRGHGRSASPPGPYRIEQLADDALGLLDALGLDRVHLCGLSMGGMLAQRIATVSPGRLHSVALAATSAYLNVPGVWDERIRLARAGGMPAVVEATIERWFSQYAIAAIPGRVDAVRRGILATSVNGYCACCAAIREMDQRATIGAIAPPVIVIVGEDDPSTTVSHAREIHASISGSELEIIPAARHFVNVEQADEFNRLLLGFLERGGA